MAVFLQKLFTFETVGALDSVPPTGNDGTSNNILLGIDASNNLYVNGVAAPNGSAVDSVFGRTGIVVATSGDYSVAQVTGAAPLASPALTGNPTTPNQTALTNNTRIANTAYADAAVAVETSRAEAAEALAQPAAGRNAAGPTGYTGFVAAPAHFNSTGVAGSIAVDATNFYVCVATNSWVQVSTAGVFSTSF